MRLVKRQEVAKRGRKESEKDGERDNRKEVTREEKEKGMAIEWEKKGSWLPSLGWDWPYITWLYRVGGGLLDLSPPEGGHSSHSCPELPPFTLNVLLSWASEEWAVTVRWIINEGLCHDYACRKRHISVQKISVCRKSFILRLQTDCPFKHPNKSYLIQFDPLFRHSGFRVL